MSEQKDLFVLSVLLLDYFLEVGEAGRASPWTLSEMLLMVFQRRVSLSDYEDVFFQPCVSLVLPGGQRLQLHLGSFSSDQCGLYQYHHPRLHRDLLKAAVLKCSKQVEGKYCLF